MGRIRGPEAGQYKLWYHAIGNLGPTIAYATSLDGIQWEKHGPISWTDAGWWDVGTWGPSVLKVGELYWMWYAGGGPDYPGMIGVATSPDGVTWTRAAPEAVVIDPVSTNAIGDPAVIFEDGIFKMWYGSFSEGAIYYAESPDGIVWTVPIRVLGAGPAVEAAAASPFVGYWMATDPQAGEIRLRIEGPPMGHFEITWVEAASGFCGGAAGLAFGDGWLDAMNQAALEADLRPFCLGSGRSDNFQPTWTYDPEADRVVSGETVWERLPEPACRPVE